MPLLEEVRHGDGMVTVDGKKMDREALYHYRATPSTRDRERVRGGTDVRLKEGVAMGFHESWACV